MARLAVKNFNGGDWQALGAYTNATDVIQNHDRLLRSLSFGDDDYSGNAHGVIFTIAERDPKNVEIIEEFITSYYGEPDEPVSVVSTAPSKSRTIAVRPAVFDIPEGDVETDLIGVMCPFGAHFEPVFGSIVNAARHTGFRCLRAKDIWLDAAIIQDVFSLIYRAHIIVCDFTGQNPNVFYEAGIAHTLGKHVIPITQSAHDVPFDLQHHRYKLYLNNAEGRQELETVLAQRFRDLSAADHPLF